MNRARDWFKQAQYNLLHAQRSIDMGDYAWACFAAHQAAEAALKGLHLRLGQVAWGHSVSHLLLTLPGRKAPSEELVAFARFLDKQYIPSRYPDAHPDGPASENYTLSEARYALEAAEKILLFCGAGL
ncbi:MAG: HEPN domain-containing protein [Bacteroidia bacterium]|nr:HEPN domain-containing protein [Bacteroidia bacterium]